MSLFDDAQIDQFISDGYIRVPQAFGPEIVKACQDEIWDRLIEDTPSLKREDPSTWTKEFIRLPDNEAPCILEAAHSPKLFQAFDEIVGERNWKPHTHVGSYPVRFPGDGNAAWADWHIDGSIFVGKPGEETNDPDDYPYHVNINSDGRAALVLFLFSDMETPETGAVKIAKGSHLDVPKLLVEAGKHGIHPDVVKNQMDFDSYEIAHALGKAGDVYVVNPFTFHSGRPNVGTIPRFLGQPELPPAREHPCLNLDRTDGKYSVMERSVLQGLK